MQFEFTALQGAVHTLKELEAKVLTNKIFLIK